MPHLLAYAEERETDKVLMPLWIANYAVAKIAGKETLAYTELLKRVAGEGNSSPAKSAERTPDEIELDFEAIIRRDRQHLTKEV